jgi:beta-glucosidase
LAYWDIALRRWVVAACDYTIQINENASTVLLQETVRLAGDDVMPVLSLQSNVAEWMQHPHAGPALRKRMSEVTGQDLTEETDKSRMIASMPMVQILGMVGGAIDSEWLISLLAEPAVPGE